MKPGRGTVAAVIAVALTGTIASGATYAATEAKSYGQVCLNDHHTVKLLQHGQCPDGYVKAIIGARGATGEQGPQGAKGDTGLTGPQGPKGDTGAAGGGETFVPMVDSVVFGIYGCGSGYTEVITENGCPNNPAQEYDAYTIDSADFAPSATIRLEVSMTAFAPQGSVAESEVCARLLDVTTQMVAVPPLCATNTDANNDLHVHARSAKYALPSGSHEYRVEVAAPLSNAGPSDVATDSDAGSLTRAIAIVEN
jgi:hypothetical protein